MHYIYLYILYIFSRIGLNNKCRVEIGLRLIIRIRNTLLIPGGELLGHNYRAQRVNPLVKCQSLVAWSVWEAELWRYTCLLFFEAQSCLHPFYLMFRFYSRAFFVNNRLFLFVLLIYSGYSKCLPEVQFQCSLKIKVY